MATDRTLKRHAERLVGGDYSAQDFQTLLLAMRSRPYGSQVICEMGDFTAHRADRRIKGILTEAVRDFFVISRFKVQTLGEPLDLNDLPGDTLKCGDATLRVLDQSIIRKHTSFRTRQTAKKAYVDIKKKFRQLDSGNFRINVKLTQPEIDLLECITSYIVSKPAFDEDVLFREFLNTLEKNRLIEASDRIALRPIKPHLTVFALWVMHDSTIKLADDDDASLQLAFYGDSGGSELIINAAAKVTSRGGEVEFHAPIFTSSLRMQTHCDDKLVEHILRPGSEPPNLKIDDHFVLGLL